jgi:hypothetical protein
MAARCANTDHHFAFAVRTLRGFDMQSTSLGTADVEVVVAGEPQQSAVSWSAIFAGGVVAFAAAIILVALGTGFGLSSISPYQGAGISATTFAISTAVWLIIVQWLSSALGGYLAGRLRSRWVNVHADEKMFRDTAHGLLAWAVAVALGVGLFSLGAAATSKQNVASVRTAYYVDQLFRTQQRSTATLVDDKTQATHVFEMGAIDSKVRDSARPYLTELVTSATGLSAADAQARVNQVVQQATDDAENARKAAAKIAFYTFFSLLIGAFIACTAAALGGRQRGIY